MVWAVCMIRSRIASAIVGSPTMSYQLEDGYCDVMMTDFRSCLPVLNNFKQYGTLLASRVYDEQVVKYE